MSPRWIVLVVTSPSGETVPLQPNHRPPWCLSKDRTATARPPAWLLSGLGSATRLETTISRANIDPPSCATAASRSRSGRPSNRFAEKFPFHGLDGADEARIVSLDHAQVRQQQNARVKIIRAESGSEGLAFLVPRSLQKRLMHRLGNGIPMRRAIGKTQPAGNGGEPVAAGPAHRRRVGVDALSPAIFPNAVVGLQSELSRLAAERLQQPKQSFV